MYKYLLFILIAVLSGCGQLQNVTVDQIRNEKHLRSEGEFERSISEIQQSLRKLPRQVDN